MQPTGLEELIDGAKDYERLLHYNGEVVLEYSHSLHAYTVFEDGERRLVPGSTTVCGMIDKSGPLTQWAANETVNWIISHFPRTLLNGEAEIGALEQAYACLKNKAPWEDGFTELVTRNALVAPIADLAKLLNEARFNYRTISKDATDIGHLAHTWLEGYIKHKIAEAGQGFFTLYAEPLPTDEKAANCVRAAMAWFDKHGFRPVFSEKKLYSRTHGYAGTCDWLAYVTSCGDPACCPFEGEALVLGDFKSSRSLYDEYFCQLASYRFAIEEEFPELKIGACMLLRLGKEDGEFEVRTATQEEFDSDLDGFLGCLQMYHWQKQRDLNKRYEKALEKARKTADKDAEKQATKLAKEQAKAEKAAAKAATAKPKRMKRAVVREISGSIEVESIKSGVIVALDNSDIPIEGAA